MSTRSAQCDRSQHADCDGTARILDQDGPNDYTCRCGCHPQHKQKTCTECNGRGSVSYVQPPVIEKRNRRHEVGA